MLLVNPIYQKYTTGPISGQTYTGTKPRYMESMHIKATGYLSVYLHRRILLTAEPILLYNVAFHNSSERLELNGGGYHQPPTRNSQKYPKIFKRQLGGESCVET